MAKRAAEVAMEIARRTRVFISYSRKDAEFVARLKDALDGKDYDAFVDTKDISGGEEWRNRLDQLILRADAVVFVVSPDSIVSEMCDWETRRALALGKRLIPVLWRDIGEAMPPQQLAERNYISFDAPEKFGPGLSHLCDACDVDIGWTREHTRLVELATRWDATGRKSDLLLRGEERIAADDWRSRRMRRAPEIPETLAEYLSGSLAEEKRSTRARRGMQTAVSALALIAIGVATVWANWTTIYPMWVSHTQYRPYVHTAESLAAGPIGAQSEFQDCRRGSHDCPVMIVIPTGQFMMGSADDDPNQNPEGRERPIHNVSIRAFAVGKYHVTFDEWQVCADAMACNNRNPGDMGWGRGRRPVINVGWDDAQEYVAWLSRMTGRRYRLLTEEEWEYSARGYTRLSDPHYQYPWGDDLPTCDVDAPNGAAFTGCNHEGTFPVGSFRPNRFGLYDMAGNVFGWVEDCLTDYRPTRTASDRADGPVIRAGGSASPPSCQLRVDRGGSWNDYAHRLRSADRDDASAWTRSNLLGFRVARTL